MPDAPEARGTLRPRAGGGTPQAPGGRLRTWARFVRFEHTLFSLPLLFAGLLGFGALFTYLGTRSFERRCIL